ncbi:MAG: hypothetical protein ACHREM_28975 [Polyangiales bacterium]
MKRAAIASLTSLLVSGCASVNVADSHMHLAPGPVSHDPTMALVVVARPRTPCDNSDRFLIVDDAGRFVGESIAGGRFELEVTPGAHAFYAWDPEQKWIVAKFPTYDDAGGVAVTVEPGASRVVLASRPNVGRLRGRACNTLAPIRLRVADAEEIDGVIESTTLLVTVDAPTFEPGEVERHVERARARMP